jgi:hypothetical protein
MLAVKPSITGIGSSRTSLPTRANASTTRSVPAVHPEPVRHRDEDHRHRPGGPGHLQVAPAEHGGERPGDDRGDEAGLGAEP